jgi:hypothetical protein
MTIVNSLATGIFWPVLGTNCTQTLEFDWSRTLFFPFICLKYLYIYIIRLHIVPNRQIWYFDCNSSRLLNLDLR